MLLSLNLQKIRIDSVQAFAEEKAIYLESTNEWEHDSNGCNFDCRVNSSEINKYTTWVGENLYKGKCDIDSAYKLWEQSPTHKAVLDHSSDYEYTATSKYKKDQCYYVLIKVEYKK